MNKLLSLTAIAAALAVSGAAHAATISWSYEAPGSTNTSVALASSGVETFNEFTNPNAGAAITFNTVFGGGYSGTYAGVEVSPTTVYGGASNSNYALVSSGDTPYTLTLDAGSPAANFFGVYISAADATNYITFKNGSDTIGTYSVAQAFADNAIDNQGWVFVNLKTSTPYTQIVFGDAGPGNHTYGFETDNHTIGFAGGVPEPASWALMILGFGGVGASLRNRRRAAVAA